MTGKMCNQTSKVSCVDNGKDNNLRLSKWLSRVRIDKLFVM